MVVQDSYAYVAALEGGIQVVDISDPNNLSSGIRLKKDDTFGIGDKM